MWAHFGLDLLKATAVITARFAPLPSRSRNPFSVREMVRAFEISESATIHPQALSAGSLSTQRNSRLVLGIDHAQPFPQRVTTRLCNEMNVTESGSAFHDSDLDELIFDHVASFGPRATSVLNQKERGKSTQRSPSPDRLSFLVRICDGALSGADSIKRFYRGSCGAVN
jgi:hypothetical protein